MPIPKPQIGEDQASYIQRCMSTKKMIKEYPRQDQRLAVCYLEWKKQ
jgi:hypothetical protein